VLLWLVVYAVYLGAQALVADQAARAQANAADLRELEAALGVDLERSLHDALRPIDGALATWYLAGYVPILVAGLLWLGLSDRRAYRRARRALLAAFATGLAAFMLFPVAPPRLVPGLSLGAEAGLSTGHNDLFGLPYNEYAAFPSLHVGALIVLAGVAVTVTGSRVLRALWLAQALVMAIAVVGTGNHYVVDVVGGAAIGVALLPVAIRPARLRRSNLVRRLPEGAARPSAPLWPARWARSVSAAARLGRPRAIACRCDDELAHLTALRQVEGEQHRPRDVGRVVEADVGGRAVALFPPVEERRAHASGHQHGDADLVAELSRERTREADDAELRGAVRRRVG
jgi:membrane-associated phospholipid phosphatase